MTKLVIKTLDGWVKTNNTFTNNFKEAKTFEGYEKALSYACNKIGEPYEIQPLAILNGSFWNQGNN